MVARVVAVLNMIDTRIETDVIEVGRETVIGIVIEIVTEIEIDTSKSQLKNSLFDFDLGVFTLH